MIPYRKGHVCLNVLAGSKKNAKELSDLSKDGILIGVLSSKYADVNSAVTDLRDYMLLTNGNLSIGLGNGDPNQWRMVGDIARQIKAKHFNQVFTGVGYTAANLVNEDAFVNALVSPCGIVGKVKISTGPQSSTEEPAIVPIKTAISMAKDMGAYSLKYFPMKGTNCIDELRAVAKACGESDFVLEPTGGINLDNFEFIMSTILNEGVEKVVPHVYSSIIDQNTGETRICDVKKLFDIIDLVI